MSNDKSYKEMRYNNVTQIIGVWDDHDYGKNDGNKYMIHTMKKLIFHFLKRR